MVFYQQNGSQDILSSAPKQPKPKLVEQTTGDERGRHGVSNLWEGAEMADEVQRDLVKPPNSSWDNYVAAVTSAQPSHNQTS
jgi:hypothetical protein